MVSGEAQRQFLFWVILCSGTVHDESQEIGAPVRALNPSRGQQKESWHGESMALASTESQGPWGYTTSQL